jgi:hypothetical protein
MTVPDRELVERARQGDGAAIAELFSRYWRAVGPRVNREGKREDRQSFNLSVQRRDASASQLY